MSSAPWWFVLVTALLTGAFTLVGSWLTGRLNLRRQREELAHSKALQREKELYDRRLEFYFELLPKIEKVENYVADMTVIASISPKSGLRPSPSEVRALEHLYKDLIAFFKGHEIICGDSVSLAFNRYRDTLLQVQNSSDVLLTKRRILESSGELTKHIRIEIGST